MEKPFKQRVIDSWQLFAEKEAEIRQLMDSKADANTLINSVDEVLKTAFETSYFEMGFNTDQQKYELILTPEGDRVRLIQLKYWQSMAPESLKEKWNFYSTKPAIGNPGFTLQMFDITLGLDDVEIYPQIDEEKQKVDIEVYAPKLMALDENKRYSMFFIFLDQFISELYTMEYVGFIDVSEEECEGEKINVVELKKLIEESITKYEWVKPEEVGHTYSSYKMTPSQADNWLLRQDVIIGITTSFDVINEYYSKGDELVKKYEVDGMTFGFVFYENINIPQKEVVGVRGEIEDKILEQAEALHIASSLGGATGNYFSYMDFVIYDQDSFLLLVKDILSEYNFKETGFSRFILGSDPVFFNQ